MIRRGIYNLSQLKTNYLNDFFGKERNISVYLYNQVWQNTSEEEKLKSSELILNRFNTSRNVIKRTYKNRFDEFDNETILTIVSQNYSTLSLLDMAVSDGSASCFFLEQLHKRFSNLEYTGSDLNINYYLYKREADKSAYVITDERNDIIEITNPPFVWNYARKEGWAYFINNLLKNISLKRAKKLLGNRLFKYQEKIELIHPDYRKLLSESVNFKIKNHNLFNEIDEKFEVIRAMNILHYGYFTHQQLSQILKNIYAALKIDGLFIEGANEEPGTPVEGAIYRKIENGFILFKEPEKQSRIKNQVLSFTSLKND